MSAYSIFFYSLLTLLFARPDSGHSTPHIETKNSPPNIQKTIDQRINDIFFQSRQNREKKSMSLHLGAGLIGYNVQWHWWQHAQQAITLSAYYQEDIITGISTYAGAGIKQFFGNSLFLNIESGIHAGEQIDYIQSVAGERVAKKSYDLGIDIAFGNEWHYDSWSFGGQWFGFYLPLIALDQSQSVQIRIAFLQVGYAW